MNEPPQLEHWMGDFGDAYIDRNPAEESDIAGRARALGGILNMLPEQPESILEVGSNIGMNLLALSRVSTAELWAVEPNQRARDELIAISVTSPDSVIEGHAGNLDMPSDSIDLVFTSGVLIHIPDSDLDGALNEIFRVSKRWILSVEYFAPRTTAETYRGIGDLMWKRDYGGLWLDRYNELVLVSHGFFWQRTVPFDNSNWWLFEKRQR